MSRITISNLSDAATLSGAEFVPIVQNGTTLKTPASAFIFGATGTLQTVTDAGNTTTNSVTVAALNVDGKIVGGSGSGNAAGGIGAVVLGGCNNITAFDFSNVVGGKDNIASGFASNVAGGVSNKACGNYSNVAGGLSGCTIGMFSNVAGGCYNIVYGSHNNVAGGDDNQISTTSNRSNIAGGSVNFIDGIHSSVAGGTTNEVFANCSAILGGNTNTILSAHNDAFIVGSNITSSAACYTFVNNLSSQGVVSANIILSGSTNLLDIFSTDAVDFSTDIDSLSSAIDNNSTDIDSLSSAIDNNSTDIDSLSSAIDSNSTDIDSLSSVIDELDLQAITDVGSVTTNSLSVQSLSAQDVVSANTFLSSGTNLLDIFNGGGGVGDLQAVTSNGNTTTNSLSVAALSSFGNIIGRTGFENTSIGANATGPLGGGVNKVQSVYSVVVGGRCNCALPVTGGNSVVVGGFNNRVYGAFASIVGGSGNCALSANSFIGGGESNKASLFASVVGGSENCAEASFSAILGGEKNCILKEHEDAFIIGSNITSSASGFTFVNNLDSEGVVSANTFLSSGTNLLDIFNGGGGVGDLQAVTAAGNTTTNSLSVAALSAFGKIIAGAGYGNSATSIGAAVLGGHNNMAAYDFSSILGGSDNIASGGSFNGGHATVAGGKCNVSNGGYSAIGGGRNNYIGVSAVDSTIVGGISGSICSLRSAILGGKENCIQSDHDNAFIVGSEITSVSGCMLHANCLWLGNLPSSDTDLVPGIVWNDSGTLKIKI